MHTPNSLSTVVLACAFAWTAAAPSEAEECRPAPLLGRQVLAADGQHGLAFESRFGIGAEALADGRVVITVDTRVPAATLRQLGERADVCLSLLADDGEDLQVIYETSFEAAGLDDAYGFRFAVELPLPEDALGVIAVLDVPSRDRWGGVAAEQTEDVIPPPGPDAFGVPGALRAWYEVDQPSIVAKVDAPSETVLRLVPPRREPASGPTRIWAIVSTPSVDRVDFYLDDALVTQRGRRPFVASIPLAKPARVQQVRAVAFDRNGLEMGTDLLEVNQVDAPFRVRITGVEGDPSSDQVTVSADVVVPLDGQLEDVSIFVNEQPLGAFDGPPYRHEVVFSEVGLAAVGPTDFVRVAATLADGRTIDDVVMLLAPGLLEEVDVNLVTVHAVVTDARGTPITDLGREDFAIQLRRGAPLPIEGFSYADDVPLLLGLVIDTSASMSLVIEDTRRAASRFVTQTVQPGDRGFIVDFDQQPRLLRDTTDDPVALLTGLGGLEAKGRTSLYDAVVFSMVQFERQGGRKALVVLSDGADLDSRFGPKDCIDLGRRLGVAIYMLALDSKFGSKIPIKELRRIAEATGGTLFLADGIEQLAPAYARINAELRSQYTLTFYTERDLSDDERREVEVVVDPVGARVRTVVGTGTGSN